MKFRVLIILTLGFVQVVFSQNTTTVCNRAVAFQYHGAFLPTDFCMPQEYWVVDVFKDTEADLNSDGINDRIIQFNKEKLQCGDTIFFAIYLAIDTDSFRLAKILSNLCPPMARYPDISWIVDNCKDAFASRWGFDNVSLIRFENGLIKVPFSINTSNGFDFYFEYDKNLNNWYLTKKQGWSIIDGGSKGTINNITREGNQLDSISNGMSIDDFKIEQFLQPD